MATVTNGSPWRSARGGLSVVRRSKGLPTPAGSSRNGASPGPRNAVPSRASQSSTSPGAGPWPAPARAARNGLARSARTASATSPGTCGWSRRAAQPAWSRSWQRRCSRSCTAWGCSWVSVAPSPVASASSRVRPRRRSSGSPVCRTRTRAYCPRWNASIPGGRCRPSAPASRSATQASISSAERPGQAASTRTSLACTDRVRSAVTARASGWSRRILLLAVSWLTRGRVARTGVGVVADIIGPRTPGGGSQRRSSRRSTSSTASWRRSSRPVYWACSARTVPTTSSAVAADPTGAPLPSLSRRSSPCRKRRVSRTRRTMSSATSRTKESSAIPARTTSHQSPVSAAAVAAAVRTAPTPAPRRRICWGRTCDTLPGSLSPG
ncbi:hypothetical protein [Ornithinimicrobium kibberense]|uniref:hypothetical protein n=1 Tax=Ornithinimicrobium kibberense TaxID=282060 RepID=UPI00360C3F9A